VSLAGTDADQYVKRADGCAGQAVAPTQSCTFQVLLAPTAVGPFAASIQIASNAGPLTVQIGGEGVADNRFTISHLKVAGTGFVRFHINVPGPGQIDVLETAWIADETVRSASDVSLPGGQLDTPQPAWVADEARAATVLLQPAAGRFVFARAHLMVWSPATIHMRVRPNSRGTRLVQHHRYAVGIRLWVVYQPSGGTPRKRGFYGFVVVK
jgi:hypothetical protein